MRFLSSRDARFARRAFGALSIVTLIVALSPAVSGQQPPGAGGVPPPLSRAPRNFNMANMPDPPAPVAPDVISRGENGRVVVRATKLTEPLRIDGRLDEEAYSTVRSMGDFIQNVPDEGAPASEKTEAWILYDNDNIYVSCRCWDSAPPEQWVANELRRDTAQLRQNDNFAILLDTFHDQRNGFAFYNNPLGGYSDFWVTDEGNPNMDWNPVWFVRTGRFEGGWTVEMAIPLKSIRYQSGTNQTWGIQIRRAVRRKNEFSLLTFVPASSAGAGSIFRVSAGATLVGLDLPPASKNMEFKPYGISKLTTDRLKNPQILNDLTANGGLDAKYGITANLTADVTINTDFAQVEVDEQQVNLTRFALVFPEKREFFLEGRGMFEFGRGSGTGGGGASTGPPQLFYTRRIGLNNGREIPIRAGGRMTGKVGDTSIGIINMQTGYESPTSVASDRCLAPYTACTPSTNFTVLRVRRDILDRSTIGAMFTNRSVSSAAPGGNQAFGVDAAFAFFQNVTTGVYYSRSQSELIKGDDASYQGRFDYSADRYGLRFDYLNVGTNFNPEIGLVQRRGFGRTYGAARFSPRMRRSRWVRRYVFEGSIEYLENKAGQLESRRRSGRFQTEFQSSDLLNVEVESDYELLIRPFAIARGVTIPVGSYPFKNATMSYAFGQQRRMSGTVAVQAGQFYDGDILSLTVSTARVSILKQFSLEPGLIINHVTLPAGEFTNKLLRSRVDYGFSPRMFLSALVQWSSSDHTYSSNYRFRWEYRPGSEIYVVYTDERDTTLTGYPTLRNRAFVVKANRLLRF
jgi:hypothetical protein